MSIYILTPTFLEYSNFYNVTWAITARIVPKAKNPFPNAALASYLLRTDASIWARWTAGVIYVGFIIATWRSSEIQKHPIILRTRRAAICHVMLGCYVKKLVVMRLVVPAFASCKFCLKCSQHIVCIFIWALSDWKLFRLMSFLSGNAIRGLMKLGLLFLSLSRHWKHS